MIAKGYGYPSVTVAGAATAALGFVVILVARQIGHASHRVRESETATWVGCQTAMNC